jgi:capsid assembly protease
MKAKLFQMATGVPWHIQQEVLDGLLYAPEADWQQAKPESVAIGPGRPLDGAQKATARGGIATIPIIGPIFRYSDWMTSFLELTTVESIARDLGVALSDSSVRGVLLEIDSPGGMVSGTGELAGMISAASALKPVVAYVSNYGASGAYWLSSAAQHIAVAPQAMLGSIGTIFTVSDPTKENPNRVVFVSDQSPDKRPDPTTEKGRAQFQKLVNDLTSIFVADVARNRQKTPEVVLENFGRGGLLVGEKAIAAGMADSIGTYESVLHDMDSGRLALRGARVAAAETPSARRTNNELARERPGLSVRQQGPGFGQQGFPGRPGLDGLRPDPLPNPGSPPALQARFGPGLCRTR